MTARLFVARLSYDTTESTLQQLFSEYGDVVSISIIMDRETNKSKGFGFVEMKDDAAAKAAIEGLNDKDVDGRSIAVSVAHERDSKPRSQAGYRRSW